MRPHIQHLSITIDRGPLWRLTVPSTHDRTTPPARRPQLETWLPSPADALSGPDPLRVHSSLLLVLSPPNRPGPTLLCWLSNPPSRDLPLRGPRPGSSPVGHLDRTRGHRGVSAYR